jgi:hypothetical protein
MKEAIGLDMIQDPHSFKSPELTCQFGEIPLRTKHFATGKEAKTNLLWRKPVHEILPPLVAARTRWSGRYNDPLISGEKLRCFVYRDP